MRENEGAVAFPTGVPALTANPPDSPSVPYSGRYIDVMPADSRFYGPHEYGLYQPGRFHPLHNINAVIKPNGYSHGLHADLTISTWRHYAYARGNNWEGILSPERVD